MTKREAVEKCLYGVIWWVGAGNWNQELNENVLKELEKLYDDAYADGFKDGETMEFDK